ncbi:MAG: glycosyltransferase family 4 protein [Pseudomonadales bacterium]
MVIGVAPYVQDLLPMKIKRFEAISEIGMEEVSAAKAYTEELCLGAKLLYVGRIVRTKGLRDAITALSMIPKTLKWRLDVLGDGDDREYCENLVSQLRLRDAIHFHGRVPRSIVDGYYRNADLFLFPSFREPSGNVVIEALSHGLPVITSSIGGPGFAVDGSCGRTIRAVSPQQYSKDIAKALLELLRDPIEMSRLSCGAIERVKSEYLWSNKAQRMLQIYRDVVDKHHS